MQLSILKKYFQQTLQIFTQIWRKKKRWIFSILFNLISNTPSTTFLFVLHFIKMIIFIFLFFLSFIHKFSISLSLSPPLCVCVCVRERERERERITLALALMPLQTSSTLYCIVLVHLPLCLPSLHYYSHH